MPLVLGGDHSLSLPTLHVLAEVFGSGGYAVLQLDSHVDTAATLYGVRVSHGTPFRVAVEDGALRGANVVQIGLRGTWDPDDLAWMAGQGFRWHTMDDIVRRGLPAVVQDAVAQVAALGLPTYLTVDIDVLDPAFAPGTGTPEPGGLSTRELLWTVRQAAMQLDLRAMDVVEVSPAVRPRRDHGARRRARGRRGPRGDRGPPPSGSGLT
jgi:agmatinase